MGVFNRFADFAKRRNSRFCINVDADEDLNVVVKKTFSSIEKDEPILFVIDDSPLVNRKNMVVFTNKRICWNLKSAYLNVTADNTRHETLGPYNIDLAKLSDATIFTHENSRATTIYAISKTVQMEIRLRHKLYGDVIGLFFSEKLLSSQAGYNADRKSNAALFKEFVLERKKAAVKKITPRGIFAVILGGANVIVHLLLLAVAIASLAFTELAVPKVPLFIVTLLFCLSNAFFGKKNSASLIFLLISVVCVIFLLGTLAEIPFNMNRLFLIYGILALLLNIADFDKIFKQVTGFFAVCAVIFMILRFL
jgi:hypothetical protein